MEFIPKINELLAPKEDQSHTKTLKLHEWLQRHMCGDMLCILVHEGFEDVHELLSSRLTHDEMTELAEGARALEGHKQPMSFDNAVIRASVIQASADYNMGQEALNIVADIDRLQSSIANAQVVVSEHNYQMASINVSESGMVLTAHVRAFEAPMRSV